MEGRLIATRFACSSVCSYCCLRRVHSDYLLVYYTLLLVSYPIQGTGPYSAIGATLLILSMFSARERVCIGRVSCCFAIGVLLHLASDWRRSSSVVPFPSVSLNVQVSLCRSFAVLQVRVVSAQSSYAGGHFSQPQMHILWYSLARITNAVGELCFHYHITVLIPVPQ